MQRGGVSHRSKVSARAIGPAQNAVVETTLQSSTRGPRAAAPLRAAAGSAGRTAEPPPLPASQERLEHTQPGAKTRSRPSGRGPEQGPGRPRWPDPGPHRITCEPWALRLSPMELPQAQSSWQGGAGWGVAMVGNGRPTVPTPTPTPSPDGSATKSADEPPMLVQHPAPP